MGLIDQFEIIINVLVRSSRLICIPMLWVHGHYKYFNTFSAGTVFIRQNLTYKDGPRAEKVNFARLAYDSVQIVYLIFAHLK